MSVRLIRGTRLYPGAPCAYAAVTDRPGMVLSTGRSPRRHPPRPGRHWPTWRCPEESGATIRDVIKTTVYVASSDLVAAWNEVAAAFAGHDVPSTLLGVSVLGYPHQLVEIGAIATIAAQDHAGSHSRQPHRRAPRQGGHAEQPLE